MTGTDYDWAFEIQALDLEVIWQRAVIMWPLPLQCKVLLWIYSGILRSESSHRRELRCCKGRRFELSLNILSNAT